MSSDDVQKIYLDRFHAVGVEKRDRVWKILCQNYFQELIGPEQIVLDIACGYGEFINNIAARKKYAIDINPDSPSFLNKDVEFHACLANELSFIEDATLDVAFTSNFLEHLPDKAACDAVLSAVFRKLRPGGKFVILGPNIRYAYKEYWDFYDHYLALSDKSLSEGLKLNGYNVVSAIPQFLPYTMNSKKPTADIFVVTYLKLPFLWKIFGRQFLVVGQRPLS